MKTIHCLTFLLVPMLLGNGLAAAPAVGASAKAPDRRDATERSDGAPEPQDGTLLPESAVALLKPVALATADGAAALAADDLTAYKKTLPAVRTALVAFFEGYAHAEHGLLSDYRTGLSNPGDLASARREFERFSTAVANLALGSRLHESARLHVYECPMTPVLGTARWLQRDSGTKNPFFGSRMQACGKKIAAPAAMPTTTASLLPAGHPPLDAATMAAFARLRPQAATRTDGSCGSCGMSKAAMAAGESCNP